MKTQQLQHLITKFISYVIFVFLGLCLCSCASNANKKPNISQKNNSQYQSQQIDLNNSSSLNNNVLHNDGFDDFHQSPIVVDKYEKFNRKIYAFNNAIDKTVLRPIAVGYDFIMPDPLQKGVTNAFSNLGEIPNIFNDVLQCEPKWLLVDSWRLIINTTVGVGGLFDIASKTGLPKHKQTFGLTLAKWGYKNSNFLMLPLLGPSTVRDALSFPVNYSTNVINYIEPKQTGYALTALQLINTRANLLIADNIMKQAFDPYIFVRDAYMQNINYRINPEHSNDFHG